MQIYQWRLNFVNCEQTLTRMQQKGYMTHLGSLQTPVKIAVIDWMEAEYPLLFDPAIGFRLWNG